MNRPFSHRYVINETLKHMTKSVGISTQKTIARLADFADDPEKTAEIMATLASLNQLNNLIESVRTNNQEILA